MDEVKWQSLTISTSFLNARGWKAKHYFSKPELWIQISVSQLHALLRYLAGRSEAADNCCCCWQKGCEDVRCSCGSVPVIGFGGAKM